LRRTAAFTRWTIALGLAGALVGCKPVEPDADASDDSDDDSGMNMQDRDSGARTDSGSRDGSTPRTDGGADGGVDGEMPMAETAPELEEATARQAGRFGEDFRLDVVGTDPDGDAIAVRITLYAANGDALALADKDGDGQKDVGEAELPLKAALAKTPSAESYLLIPGLFRQVAALDHASVALVDATGLASDSIDVDVVAQQVLAGGEICDDEYIENRCADGFGCKGSVPTVCEAGVAPTISRILYLADDLGTRVLLEGTDPDLDARRYKIEFFDASNQPVLVDLDGDDVPDRAQFDDVGNFVWDGTKYFLRLDQGDTFADLVAKVRVTITDRGSLQSTPSALIAKATTPTRQAGQTCDPRTFDRCVASAVCVPTSATSKTYSCTATASARTRACSTATVLEPAEGITSVRGDIKNPSLWDAPEGCVGGSDPTRQPEALVKLILAEDAAKVTLSTNNLFTSFDSALYVLSACNAAPVLAWCEDYALDHEASAAELELTDVPAGTYFVVVDSFNSSLSGTTYQLDVSVE
jgi:hypothetical protein